jgi:hypothetical protein
MGKLMMLIEELLLEMGIYNASLQLVGELADKFIAKSLVNFNKEQLTQFLKEELK